jgi:hypothetical protein
MDSLLSIAKLRVQNTPSRTCFPGSLSGDRRGTIKCRIPVICTPSWPVPTPLVGAILSRRVGTSFSHRFWALCPILVTAAHAGKINPSETSITLPDAIEWSSWIEGFPPHSGQMATLYGGLDKSGPYVVFMKWYPGYMSAPHTYATDRLSVFFRVRGG